MPIEQLEQCLGLAFATKNQLYGMPIWCHLVIVDKLKQSKRWQQLYFTVIFYRSKLGKNGEVSLFIPCQVRNLSSLDGSLIQKDHWLNRITNELLDDQGIPDNPLTIDATGKTVSFYHFISRQPTAFNLWGDLPLRFEKIEVVPRIPELERAHNGTFVNFCLSEQRLSIWRFSLATTEDLFEIHNVKDLLTINGPNRLFHQLRELSLPEFTTIQKYGFFGEVTVDITFVGGDGQSHYSLMSHADYKLRKRPQVIDYLPGLPKIGVESFCFPPTREPWLIQLSRS
ncbi:MAG: hypothetical protein WAP74_01860 [Patescibacteria group bacterium]